MTLGRTSSGAVKIKTDEETGEVSAVGCACCGCEQVYPLAAVNILTSQQYSDILSSTVLSYDLHMTYDGVTKGEAGTTDISSGCNKFFEPYSEFPTPPIYIYFSAALGILEGQRNLNLLCLFNAEYDGIGGITVVAETGDYEPLNPVGSCQIKIKGITAFSLVWQNQTGYEAAASGFFDFQ